MTLENICKAPLKAPCFNRCVQLSVNVKFNNREVSSGLRRKNTVNNAKYLRGDWKNQNGPKRCANSIPALPNDEVTSHGC